MGPQRDYKERDRKETTKNGPVKKLQRTGPQRDYKERARKETTKAMPAKTVSAPKSSVGTVDPISCDQ